MLVAPVINVKTYEEALKKVRLAAQLISGNKAWIHIDIGDGKFTPAITWGNPQEFKRILSELGLQPDMFSIHLMVQDPLSCLENWIEAGARYFVIHEEAILDVQKIKNLEERYKAEISLSVDAKKEGLSDKAKYFNTFQVLAVPPGFSGQKFDDKALEKIKLLRAKFPKAKIEVDGGMNPETVKKAKEAGADAIVSESYIFRSSDPKKAYEELARI